MTIDHPRYTTQETLGEGAQGHVVRVVDRERPALPLVAKVVQLGRGRSAEVDARLAGEFALLARLRVPGLVRVHDFGRDSRGVLFLVEDLVEGDDAITAVGGAGTRAEDRALRLVTLAAELAETLAAIHDAGFVHGDVKPSNVRVPRSRTTASRAMLLDLGASVASREVGRADGRPPDEIAAMHTPAFAAPEVRAGAPPSPAADLFGLGATLWACATGSASRAGDLRDRAPWVSPRLADLVALLVAPHPADRPRSAHDVIAALGRSTPGLSWESGAREEHVREPEVRRILSLDAGPKGRRVVYVMGPSGAGKSHLVREAITRVLLGGRQARLVRFPEADAAFVARLVSWLRGGAEMFDVEPGRSTNEPLLLVLDDLHEAPAEVVEALEAFRCSAQQRSSRDVVVVCTTRHAPSRTESIDVGLLDVRTLERLCSDQNVGDAETLAREAGGLPGWLFASLGRVPLTTEAALARVGSLPEKARSLLSLIATLGGQAPLRVLSADDDASLAACFEAGLLERERDAVRLTSRHLAADLSAAIGSYSVSDRATAIVLADQALPSSFLVAVARAGCPPERRTELIAETAERARREEARSIEIEMLLALVADRAERTPARLARLERLTRDAGVARAHPQVLAWLGEMAQEDASVAPLAARRHAEERARAGDMPAARSAAERALEVARATSLPTEQVYALATRGTIALWSAEWALAAANFEQARVLADELGPAHLDREEIARLDHNLGVVALYRGLAGEAEAAFVRSVAVKRALGDRGGVRACLLNLGLALTRLGRWDEAEVALVEATALAESLGQHAGRGWCLAARADLEVRRGRARDAERHVAEAEALGDVVPKAVRADLFLLRAQISLLEGDGRAALASLACIDADLRREDALVDARALALQARSRLRIVPVDRRAAARAAIASIRRARAGDLGEAAREAEDALRAARGQKSVHMNANERSPMPVTDTVVDASWDVLRALGTESPEVCVMRLGALVVKEAGAERAFVAETDDGGAVLRAWGVDLDGLALAEPAQRIDSDTVRSAKARDGVLYQPTIATAAGTGARLASARGRAVILVEHRFRANAFDHVSERACDRWLTMAEIVLRLLAVPALLPARSSSTSASAASSVAVPEDPLVSSTSVPRREPLRDYPDIVGRSPALRRALAQLDAAVDADLPVLIEGETGTGKELFARALHDHGQRRGGPFVAVNCAAIADALFEAELFGHARGAFTGADRARGGLLARADGGSLLLDELGELPLARQATLLRVLEERRFRPVGSDTDRPFDVRIIAATNRDLDLCVEDGSFRKDLLYRLRVLRITVPPLRDRRGDVEPLLRCFLARAGSSVPIVPAALELLGAYSFPGNVRELQHLALRLGASRLQRIEVANLPRAVRAAATEKASVTSSAERDEVESALSQTGGNISRAAGLLGLTRHGLKKRMLRLGLRAKQSVS